MCRNASRDNGPLIIYNYSQNMSEYILITKAPTPISTGCSVVVKRAEGSKFTSELPRNLEGS